MGYSETKWKDGSPCCWDFSPFSCNFRCVPNCLTRTCNFLFVLIVDEVFLCPFVFERYFASHRLLSTRFLEVFIFSLFSFRFSFHIVCMGMRIGNWVQGLGVVITQYWVFFPHLHAYHALAHLLKGISWSSSSSIIHIAPDSQSRPTPKIAEEQESTPKGYPPPYPSSSSTPQGSEKIENISEKYSLRNRGGSKLR